jgi:hypothetical protein
MYAALDVIKALEIFDKIKHMVPDLTIPLPIDRATPLLDVDVSPPKGTISHSAGLLLAQGAVAETWTPPRGFRIQQDVRDGIGKNHIVV